MKFLVIPAYEPDEKLIKLLKKVSVLNLFQIIVVNDGSGEKFNNIFNEAKEYAILLNTALAVFANGFLVKGIIEISGRSSSFDYLYIITGCFLLFGAAVFRKKKA